MGTAGRHHRTPEVSRRKTAAGTPRVVIDTNLVLSALVFASGRLAHLRTAWQGGQIQPLVSSTTAAELVRVLAYPKFRLSAADQEELLADYLPHCETVRIRQAPLAMPACRDPFDLPFLQLAIVARADALITGDQDLLSLSGQIDRPIVTAEQFFQSA